MRVSLMESRRMTEFKLERHKLLGHEIALQGLYIVDVPSDGNCQFEALAIGLGELGDHPPCDCQVLRDIIVDYLLANKELFETGQQQAFLHGDPSFKEDVLSAYGNDYTFDLYCALMRNPKGVKVNCEWGDYLTLNAALLIYSVNILVHSVCPQKGYSATYIGGHENVSWATLHVAHFQTKPEHFAAIKHRLPSNVGNDESPFAESSPELTARVRDELDEIAKTRCSELFQQYKHMGSLKETTARVYDEVIQSREE